MQTIAYKAIAYNAISYKTKVAGFMKVAITGVIFYRQALNVSIPLT